MGKKAAKRGRPRLKVTRDRNWTIRITDAQYKRIQREAKRLQISMAALFRERFRDVLVPGEK